jgi:hypothetical protein
MPPASGHEQLRVLTIAEAERMRDSEKDAGNTKLQWTLAQTPISGKLLSAHLKLAVQAGHETLVVDATWNGPSEQQVRLSVPHAKGHLARLCWTQKHQGDLHWHWFDNMTGLTKPPSESVSYVVDTTDHGYQRLFLDVAAPRLKIVNFIEGML